MTVMEFFGCTFLAFGPPLSLFWFTVANDAVKIIILIASAFFWLLSLLLSSIMWSVIYSIVGDHHLIFMILFSVVFQELGRYVVYLLLRKAEVGLNKVTDSSTKLVDNKHILAYVAGLGFGIMSGLVALINVLADSLGPGTIGLISGVERSTFFVTSSLTTLCIILLHVTWGVIFFSGLDNKKYWYNSVVVLVHFGVSALSLLNGVSYIATVICEYLILVACSVVAIRLAGGKFTKEILARSAPRTVQVPVSE